MKGHREELRSGGGGSRLKLSEHRAARKQVGSLGSLEQTEMEPERSLW